MDEDQIEGELDDFFKQGGLDVEEMQAPIVEEEIKSSTGADGVGADKEKEQLKLKVEIKDVEPDE